MRYYIIYVKVLFIFIITAGVILTFSAPSKKTPDELLFFTGGNFLYSRRTGSYSFEAIETRQDTIKKNLALGGLCFGKRYYATPWLRFQINGMFNFGGIVEDTLFFNQDTFSSKYLFKHVGCDIDIHLVRPRNKKLNLFVLCGGGINYMHLEEQLVLPEDHTQKMTISNFDEINVKYWSPSFHFGAGFDLKFTKKLGISVSYSYRIWHPVKYLNARDLPLEAIEYKEKFLTHTLQTKLLFNFPGE